MKKILKYMARLLIAVWSVGMMSSFFAWISQKELPDFHFAAETKTAYEKLVEAIENREDTVTIKSGEWDESLGEWDEVITILQDIIHENPEWYWVDFANSTYSYLGDEKNPKRAVRLNLSYHEELDNEETKAKIQAAADEILDTIPTEISDWEKARRIHDALIQHITYEENEYDQNIYGAFVQRRCVCNGYTMAYEYLLNRVGIECDTVTGYTSETAANIANDPTGKASSLFEGHAWNVVTFTMDDKTEQSYYVDVTWDDTDMKDGNGEDYLTYNWYCISRSEMDAVGHVVEGDFYDLRGWDMSYEDLNYYVYKNALLYEYDLAFIVEIFRNQISEGNNVLTVRWADQAVYTDSKVKLENGDLSYIITQLGLEQASYSFNADVLAEGNFCLNIYL